MEGLVLPKQATSFPPQKVLVVCPVQPDSVREEPMESHYCKEVQQGISSRQNLC